MPMSSTYSVGLVGDIDFLSPPAVVELTLEALVDLLSPVLVALFPSVLEGVESSATAVMVAARPSKAVA